MIDTTDRRNYQAWVMLHFLWHHLYHNGEMAAELLHCDCDIAVMARSLKIVVEK